MFFQKYKLINVILGISLSATVCCASPLSDEVNVSLDPPVGEETLDMDLEDPFEPINRGLFAINEVFDGMLFKPMAFAFRELPETLQDVIGNFFDNLSTPVIFANDVLQAEGTKAVESLTRFVVNSTLGIGGLFDVAAECMDIQPHKTDFGLTLRSYDITSGPYIFIPFIGPSTFVDAIGRGVDFFIDPVNLVLINQDLEWVTFARAGAQGIITRANVLPITEKIDKTPDPYAQYRIYYLLHRNSMVKGDSQVKRESPVPSDIIKEK